MILSSEIIGIRGINTVSLWNGPFIILAWITFFNNLFTINLTPLHNFGGCMFLSNIIGHPGFNINLC